MLILFIIAIIKLPVTRCVIEASLKISTAAVVASTAPLEVAASIYCIIVLAGYTAVADGTHLTFSETIVFPLLALLVL